MTRTPAYETTATAVEPESRSSATQNATRSGDGVRNALRELADGTAPRRPAEYEATIAEATDRLSCARDAAAFVAAGNLERLARAVGEARAAGDEAAVERGRRALATLRRLGAAARGASAAPNGEEGGDGDQFHSGHGTVLPGAGQLRNR